MNLEWNDIEYVSPPEGKVVLVYGPLGVDLAMRIEGHWYYKSGDSWAHQNLEYWCNITPTQWAEFDFPQGRIQKRIQKEEHETDTQTDRKVSPETQAMHGLTGLILMSWL